jgi:hypothetical protein
VSNRINVPTNTKFGLLIEDIVAQTMDVQGKVARLKNALDSMNQGTPATPETIEQELGLAAGDGATLYTIITDLNTDIKAVRGLQRLDTGKAV